MLEMPPVPAFIATLGTQSVAAGLALTISGGKSVTGFSIPLLIFMQTKVLMVIPTGFIIMLVCLALALFFLRRVKMGVICILSVMMQKQQNSPASTWKR